MDMQKLDRAGRWVFATQGFVARGALALAAIGGGALVGAACSASGDGTTLDLNSQNGSGASGGGGGGSNVGGSGVGGSLIEVGGSDGGGNGDGARIDKPKPNWAASLLPARHVPAGQESKAAEFTGTVGSGGPKVVYPLSGAVHPWNIGKILIQWEGSAATKYRVVLAAAGTTYEYYVDCEKPEWSGASSECSAQLPREEWKGAAFEQVGKKVTLTVESTSGAGQPIAASAPVDVQFAPQALDGALYYWAAAKKELKRASLGADDAVPFVTPNSATSEYGCVACHSVARNGKVVAFAAGPNENTSGIQIAPASSPENPTVKSPKGTSPFLWPPRDGAPTNNLGHNVALSPDGKWAVVNGMPTPEDAKADGGEVVSTESDAWPVYFEFRDTTTGEKIKRYYLGQSPFPEDSIAIFPEWSPDGTKIVAALASKSAAEDGACVWTSETCFASIVVFDVERQGDKPVALKNMKTLVEAKVLNAATQAYRYHFYPTWSPDGKYIAFSSSLHGTDRPSLDDPSKPQKSITNPNAFPFMVPSSGGPYECPGDNCWALSKCAQYGWDDAQAQKGKMSTWPKFGPFAHLFGSGSLFYLSFNSRMPFGFFDPLTRPDNEQASQLWMCAVDTGKLQPGVDPSLPPIYLPQQNLKDGSLTPYWAETLPCDISADGKSCTGCIAGEICVVLDAAANKCDCQGRVIIK